MTGGWRTEGSLSVRGPLVRLLNLCALNRLLLQAGPTWHRLFTTVGIAIGFMTLWFSHVSAWSASGHT